MPTTEQRELGTYCQFCRKLATEMRPVAKRAMPCGCGECTMTPWACDKCWDEKKPKEVQLLQHFRNAVDFYRTHDAAGVKREKRITQPQMAQKARVAQSTVSRALRTTASNVETLIRLAEACDVPAAVYLRKVADLAGGEETRAVPLNALDDMRIDRESLEEDLSNARALIQLYEAELDGLRARVQRGNP